MAPLPKNSIDHFIHPGHPLKPVDGEKEYLCDGCKMIGTGKRFRCHVCDFDLHEYCGTCPRTLNTFMHQRHALSLVVRKAQGTRQLDRVCDVCRDPVEGLFYRCKECDFDVHPLCTQLPEKLNHALHEIHPLSLESLPVAGFCPICKDLCNGWHYGCRICNFHIHLECVLVPVVKQYSQQTGQTKQRGIPVFDHGIPFQPPPQFVPYHNYGVPYNYGYPFGPGFGFGMYGQHMYSNPSNFVPQNNQVGGSNSNGTSRPPKRMFALVGQLAFGVFSNMIFGVDLASMFSG